MRTARSKITGAIYSCALAVLVGWPTAGASAGTIGPRFDPVDFASLGALAPATSVAFDTSAGTVSIDGGAAQNGVVALTEAGTEVAVFTFDVINLDGTNVTFTGSRPIALLSHDVIQVNTLLDASGASGVRSDNGNAPATPGALGGFDGTGKDAVDVLDATPAANGSGYGESGRLPGGGGGGGAHAGVGGDGSEHTVNSHGRGGGTFTNGEGTSIVYNDTTDTMLDLIGGSGGGGSGANGGNGASGGAGGGALELSARSAVHIGPSAVIRANGGDGNVLVNGSGGGAGGAIVLNGLGIGIEGTIEALGGGGGTGSARGGGGGGGGLIAVYGTTLQGTGLIDEIADGTLNAVAGGAGGTGSFTGAIEPNGADGGAGNIYYEDLGIPEVVATEGLFHLALPASAREGNYENNEITFLWVEDTHVTLSEDLGAQIVLPGVYGDDPDNTGTPIGQDASTGGPGDIAAGTTVNSYFIHFDPESGGPTVEGSITFETPVLGIITGNWGASNFLGGYGDGLGALQGPQLDPTAPNADLLVLSEDMRTVSWDFLSGGTNVDQLRIITQSVPEPASGLLLVLASVGLLLPRRQRGRHHD